MSIKDGSGNLLGPSLTLDIGSILDQFDENDQQQEYKQVTFVVLRNVSVLRRIYNFYSALGHNHLRENAIMMTKFQFWRFLKDCHIHHHNISLSAMDRAIAKGNANEDIHNPMKKILLRDFHSNCVILSFLLFHKKESSAGKRPGLVARCFQRLIDEHIAKFSGQVCGQCLSEPRRAMNALAYMERSWKIYQRVCTKRRLPPYENSFCMRQFLFLLKDLKIVGPRLSTKDVLNTLSMDDPSVSDGDNYNLEVEMTFLEFFEALIGIAIFFKSADPYSSEQRLLQSSRSKKERITPSEPSSVGTEPSSDQNMIKERTEEIKKKLSNSPRSSREEEFNIWCSKLNKFFTQYFFPAWNHTEALRNKVAKDKADQELKRQSSTDLEDETDIASKEETGPNMTDSENKSQVTSASPYEPSIFAESEFGTFESSITGFSRTSSSVGSLSRVSSSVSKR